LLTEREADAATARAAPRRFLGLLGASLAAAGVGFVTTQPRRAEASYSSGGAPDGGDLVNTSLTVQGNITLAAPYGLSAQAGNAAINLRATDNNLYLDAAGGVVVRVNWLGTAKLALLAHSSGKVGIGTAFPGATLHVDGGTLSGTSGSGIEFAGGAGGKIQSYGGPLLLNPMALAVGIGTSAPVATLDVVGSIRTSVCYKVNGVTAIDSYAVATKAYYAQ